MFQGDLEMVATIGHGISLDQGCILLPDFVRVLPGFESAT